ncbi:MAG TPA: IS21-like element helper ATPase IstB [Polyangiaceae bacterium]|nr:IS21-like element helper ATPase IstB [Polyangiaceae bacterium]
MLTEPTMEKLHMMRLGAMAAAWSTQRQDPKMNEIDFDSRFGMLVDAEHLARDNKRLKRALREAKLRISGACVEDIDYAPKRELDRTLVRQLGTCAWIGNHANVIITGATGTGKSYVACALAQQACRSGYRAAYRRMPRLFEELALAHADGTYVRLLGRLAKIDVLVLDDWGLAPLREQERRDLLEIFEDRHGARSTIITSQLPVEHWHDHVADPTIADALLDRIVHNAHRIKLKGPSKRKPEA